jgi:hypothetical protein
MFWNSYSLARTYLEFPHYTLPAAAEDGGSLIDDETGQYTTRGVFALLIASAQVAEMRWASKNKSRRHSPKLTDQAWRSTSIKS